MLLLQVPGGAELLVLILAVLGGILFPAVVMAIVARIVYYYYDGKHSYEERVSQLEREVAELRKQLQE